MTREEAIDLLDNLNGMIEDSRNSDYDTAFKMAIKALEQEPCEDCISRQAVLDAISANSVFENEYNLTASRIQNAVEALPPVTPKPKTGRWIDKDGISDFMYCSNCGGKKHYSEKWIGCPYCLADMRESYKEESEDK